MHYQYVMIVNWGTAGANSGSELKSGSQCLLLPVWFRLVRLRLQKSGASLALAPLGEGAVGGSADAALPDSDRVDIDFRSFGRALPAG